LDLDSLELLKAVLEVHAAGSFMRILKGEAPACVIRQIHETVLHKTNRHEVLDFYLVSQIVDAAASLGEWSGYGIQGSLYLTNRNAVGLIAAVDCMRRHTWSPQEVYWAYMQNRADLRLSLETKEDLAFARLACIYHVHDHAQMHPLHQAWLNLDLSERKLLARYLSADGINEKAISLMSLHLLLTHAKSNPCVGIARGLSVVAEVIDKIQAHGFTEHGDRLVTVELLDLAHFTREVKVPCVFDVCSEYVQLSLTRDGSVRVQMSAKNWQRVNAVTDGDEDRLPEISRSLRRIRWHQQTLQSLWRESLPTPRRASQ